MKCSSSITCIVILVVLCDRANSLLRRCFACRSRGEQGTCQDPFPFNVTQAADEVGLAVVPCASGWCGKLLEGGTTFKDNDYGIATERLCLQRGPDDNEERCAYTMWRNKKSFMCFCNGDLCNSARGLSSNPLTYLIPIALTVYFSTT